MRKQIIFIICSLIFCILPTFAQQDSITAKIIVQNGKQYAEVSGGMPTMRFGNQVDIQLILPNKSIADVTPQNASSYFAGVGSTVSQTSGLFNLAIALSDSFESGNYTIRVSDKYDVIENTVYLVNIYEQKNAIIKINTTIDFESYILSKSFMDMMGIELSVSNLVDVKEFCRIFSTLKPFDSQNVQAFRLQYIKTSIFALLNQKTIFSLDTYIDSFNNLDKNSLDDYKSATKEAKQSVFSQLSGKDIIDEVSLSSLFSKAVVCANISYSETLGYGHIPNILEKYKSFLISNGCNFTNYNLYTNKNTPAQKLAAVYQSFEQLKTAINKIPAPETGGVGGGGGSNSGVVGAITSKISTDLPSKAPLEITPLPFTDLAGLEWSVLPITDFYEKGYISGKSKTEFCPNDAMTREEFAKVICLAFELKGTEVLSFTDTDVSKWYAPFVSIVKDKGIIQGNEDGSFGIEEPITRQDICVILQRLLKFGSNNLKDLSFDDKQEISDYAKEAVNVFYNLKIVSGFSDNIFGANRFAKRAEVVKIIYNAKLRGIEND